MRQVVWELRTVLEKSRVRPPFVLVAHSAGGVLARLYASTYPSQVVGMVLVESGTETGNIVFKDGKSVNLIDTATGRSIPPIKTANPVRNSDITGNIRAQIEASARQMVSHATAPPYDKLPADAQRMRAWAFAQVKHWATNDNPFEGDELAALLKQRTDEKYPLGDMPLVVLSRGQDVDDAHTRNQTELVGLSRIGKQIIAQRSGHEIMITEPGLVAMAIRDMLPAMRK
jgi:pimeloyl-ACP methyl ester carboxylesterase